MQIHSDCAISGQADTPQDTCINGKCQQAAGTLCLATAQCASGICDGASISPFGSITFGTCSPSNFGSGCLADSDCGQGVCTNQQCTALPNGSSCTDSQCGNGSLCDSARRVCVSDDGSPCDSQDDCATYRACYGNTCAAAGTAAPGSSCTAFATSLSTCGTGSCLPSGSGSICSRTANGGACTDASQCLGGELSAFPKGHRINLSPLLSCQDPATMDIAPLQGRIRQIATITRIARTVNAMASSAQSFQPGSLVRVAQLARAVVTGQWNG